MHLRGGSKTTQDGLVLGQERQQGLAEACRRVNTHGLFPPQGMFSSFSEYSGMHVWPWEAETQGRTSGGGPIPALRGLAPKEQRWPGQVTELAVR